MTGRLAAAALWLAVMGEWNFFFTAAPDEVCRQLYYPGNGFIESVAIADYLKSHTAAGDRIAVLGSEPQIYFYSGRRAATSYIYTYNLMEPGPFVKRMQEDMIRQIEEARPEFIVYVKMLYSWSRTPNSDTTILDWAGKYCMDSYELTGVVDFPPWGPAQFYWGKEAAAATITKTSILVFKRKIPASEK